MTGKAFTRAVSPRLGDCALTYQDRASIDAARASAQHSDYERAIAGAGFEIVRLPDLPDHPDGVFVEDTALLLGEHAIITRPGSPSRQAETGSTFDGLTNHFTIHTLDRGTVDGGDVLRIGRRLYVGLSTRTNRDGCEALAEVASPLGIEVVEARSSGCLHLKTGATFIGHGSSGAPVLLYSAANIDPSQFDDVEPVAVDENEVGAACMLRIGDTLIGPAGYPRTADLLRKRGFDLLEIDVSELEKAEAGVTCLSLISEQLQ